MHDYTNKMATVDGNIVKLLLAAQLDEEYWLIGYEITQVINAVLVVPKLHVENYLPGGLKVIGKFFASPATRDFLEISNSIGITPALFIIRTEIKLVAYLIEPPLLVQKEVSIKQAPYLITLYSKTTIPVFSLDDPNL